jgi:hypothetical protein
MEAELREEAQGFARAVAADVGAPPPAPAPERSALRVQDVVQHPLPGYTAPVAFAFRRVQLGRCHAADADMPVRLTRATSLRR